MVKKIKMTKRQYRKLSKSWLGIIVILGILGFNFYQEYKPVSGSERFEVTLDQCIDTPESTNQIEPYGKEASDYTKEQLSNANTIELELNNDGDSEDKYGRLLAWVFVDGELLQKKLAQEGLVEKFYDYGYDYTYSELIINADKEARMENRGIYSEN